MTLPVRKQLEHTPHAVARFGAIYFITICCEVRNTNQLCHKNVADILLNAAIHYHDTSRWNVNLFLLMPDHLHALFGIPGEADLAALIGDYKRYTTRHAGVKWQRNFFDHRIRHDESLGEKGDYILQNPVRAGLVDNPEQWNYVIFGDARGTWKNEAPKA